MTVGSVENHGYSSCLIWPEEAEEEEALLGTCIQLAVNGVIAACIYTLIGVGVALVLRTAHFFHFAHAAVFIAGAYCLFLFKTCMGLPFSLSVFLAIAFPTLLGCLMELSIYRPLRRRNASSLVLLLCSLGIYIVLQNLISLAFGDDVKNIRMYDVEEGVNILGARITSIQMANVCVSVGLVLALAAFLSQTKLGIAMRAIASDSALASVCGIESNRVILSVFAIASALAAVAGILVVLDVNMTPTMGMNYLMMAVVAVVIGGVGGIREVALGALLLSMAQQLGAWMAGSQWQDVIAFTILLAFLLFKPEGLLGRKLRKAAV